MRPGVLIGQIADLRTQRLEKLGEIIDNLLVLARALKWRAAPRARSVQIVRLQRYQVERFCRLRLFQFLSDLFRIGAVAAHAPRLRLQASRKIYIRRTA